MGGCRGFTEVRTSGTSVMGLREMERSLQGGTGKGREITNRTKGESLKMWQK